MRKASLCLIIVLFSLGSPAQTLLRWNYPCKPGTECWNALTSVEERQNACQIKGIDLNTLSTEELLLITMEHPFFRSYVAHDSPIEGLSFALEGFNGFEEFRKRRNAMQTITRIYFAEDFNKLNAMADSIDMAIYSLKWIGVELIMADEGLRNQMHSDEKADFLKLLHQQLLAKQRYPEVFGGISDAASAYLFLKVRQSTGQTNFGSALESASGQLFQKNLTIRGEDIVEDLLAQFTHFINNR